MKSSFFLTNSFDLLTHQLKWNRACSFKTFQWILKFIVILPSLETVCKFGMKMQICYAAEGKLSVCPPKRKVRILIESAMFELQFLFADFNDFVEHVNSEFIAAGRLWHLWIEYVHWLESPRRGQVINSLLDTPQMFRAECLNSLFHSWYYLLWLFRKPNKCGFDTIPKIPFDTECITASKRAKFINIFGFQFICILAQSLWYLTQLCMQN